MDFIEKNKNTIIVIFYILVFIIAFILYMGMFNNKEAKCKKQGGELIIGQYGRTYCIKKGTVIK